MKQKIIMAGAVLSLMAVPASSFAATYGYVNTRGSLETVVAANAQEALALPTDRDAHSGVILLSANSPLENPATGSAAQVSVPLAPATPVMPAATMTGSSTSASTTTLLPMSSTATSTTQ